MNNLINGIGSFLGHAGNSADEIANQVIQNLHASGFFNPQSNVMSAPIGDAAYEQGGPTHLTLDTRQYIRQQKMRQHPNFPNNTKWQQQA